MGEEHEIARDTRVIRSQESDDVKLIARNHLRGETVATSLLKMKYKEQQEFQRIMKEEGCIHAMSYARSLGVRNGGI